MATNVCITIDLECTIGGAFRDPTLVPVGDQAIWCMVSGRSEGLGFLLSQFDEHGINATFFLETLNAHYFKISPMQKAAAAIHSAGHELQLHAHPCWSVFRHADWRQRCVANDRMDDFFGKEVGFYADLIRDCQSVFDDWDLPQPSIFRSGNLQHDDALFQAIAQCKIPFSSNVGLGIFNSNDPRYALYSGHHVRHGVIELPVLSFRDLNIWGAPVVKTLTISGTSFHETRALLEAAEQLQIPQVVLLTHPSEFIQTSNEQFSVTRRNRVNQRRMARLCDFLGQHRDRFPTVGLARAAHDLVPQSPSPNHLLQTGRLPSMLRKATNVINDRLGQAALGW